MANSMSVAVATTNCFTFCRGLRASLSKTERVKIFWPRLARAAQGMPRLAKAGHGWPRAGLDNFGQPNRANANTGQLWPAWANFGQQGLADFGQQGLVSKNRPTLACLGQPWPDGDPRGSHLPPNPKNQHDQNGPPPKTNTTKRP